MVKIRPFNQFILGRGIETKIASKELVVYEKRLPEIGLFAKACLPVLAKDSETGRYILQVAGCRLKFVVTVT